MLERETETDRERDRERGEWMEGGREGESGKTNRACALSLSFSL